MPAGRVPACLAAALTVGLTACGGASPGARPAAEAAAEAFPRDSPGPVTRGPAVASTASERPVVLVVPPARGDAATVGLPIPDRRHGPGAPAAGWCGESAIQQALLYFGAWVPQRLIHRAGGARTPDLYASDLPVALGRLGVRFERWPWTKRGTAPFLAWVEAALRAGDPVLLGLKVEPTRHPTWALDHFVLAVGRGPRGLQVNTTWGRQEWLSRAQLEKGTRGLVLKNRADRYYGLRLRGLAPPPAGHRPAHLVVEREDAKAVHLRASCAGLQAGSRYVLERRARPADGAPATGTSFLAGGQAHTLRVTVRRTAPAYFRCHARPRAASEARPAPGGAEVPTRERT